MDNFFLLNHNAQRVNINLIDLINKKWSKDEFNLEAYSGYQKLFFPDILTPMISETIDGEKFEILNLDVEGKVKATHYRTSTSKLEGTQLLNNITEGKKAVFININSIKQMDPNLFEITKKDMPKMTDFACKIRILPPTNFTYENVTIN